MNTIFRSFVTRSFYKQVTLITTMMLLFIGWNESKAQNLTQANIKGHAGIQVNSYTGSMFYQRNDLLIKGQGLSFDLTFSYNSGTTALDFGYGNGWTFTYNMLYEKDSAHIIVRREDGRKDIFTLNGSAYTAPVGVFDILEQYLPNKFRLTTKHGIKYFFDNNAHKKLTKIEDRNGNTITLSYTGNVPTIIQDATGRNLILTWTNGKLTQITDANASPSRIISYQYDANGNLTQVTNPLGNTIKYDYDQCKNITQLTDPRSNHFNIAYNTNNAVAGITSSFTNQTLVYDTTSRITTLTEQAGNGTQTTRYTYDTQARLIHKQGNCCGNDVYFVYDANNNIIQRTDANSNNTFYSYDSKGNVLTETDALGNTQTYIYDPAFNFATGFTDKRGNATSYTYDAKGNLTQVNKPLGITELYAYDSFGNAISFTDGKGNTTNYSYNTHGYLTNINYPIGSVSYTVNNIGNKLTATDANGHTSTYTYDAINHLLTEVNPLTETTSYAYDASGNQTTISTPNGNTTAKVYDALNRLTTVTDVMGTVAAYTYDAQSNKLTATDGNSNTTSYVYDALNRPIQVIDPESNASNKTYDNNSNPLSEQDRNGNTTTYLYDVLNRVSSVTYPTGNTVPFAYDANGNQISATDAKGNTTAYTFDALNRLTKETYADGTTKTYAYDAAGNTITRKDNAGNITTYIYDKNNRLLTRTYPDGSNDNFTYDAGGRMLSSINNNATITYTYDNADRLLSETLNGKTTAYAYNIPGRKRTITYPSGKVVEENKNVRDLLSTVKDGAITNATYTYDTGNREITRTYANGTTISFSYDRDNRITNLTHAGTATIAAFNYGFDAEGNILYQEKNHRNTHSEQYTYDAINQLSNYKEGTLTGGIITTPLTQTQYNYDGAGNRTTVTKDIATTNYTSNSTNEYTAISNTANLTYDANGNLSNDGVANYKYDFENRLTDYNPISSKKIKYKYKYDALGRRMGKQDGGAIKIDYYYDGVRVIEEVRNTVGDGGSRGGSGTVAVAGKSVFTYIYGAGIDEITAMQQGANTYYYHANALGSAIAITDNSGSVVERYEYDGYGKVSIYNASYVPRTFSSIGNVYLFTGREYDAESGLYYYRARHYSPALGRFMQQDPIGIWGDDINLGNGYSYVGNNPVNRTDVFGLRPFYGNWCGKGDNGKPPINAVDKCCMGHDKCWDENGQSGLLGWLDNTGNCNSDFVKCVWNAIFRVAVIPQSEIAFSILIPQPFQSVKYNRGEINTPPAFTATAIPTCKLNRKAIY